MMVTLANVKKYLRITTTDSVRDDLITALIPIVYADIANECNNMFRVHNAEKYRSDIYFTASGSTINLDSGGFADLGIPAGSDLVVSGSRFNDGFFTLSSQTDTALTVTEATLDEAQTPVSYPVRVAVARFPAGLDLIAARMIGYLLESVYKVGITSESVGGGEYRYTRKEDPADAGYPADILRALRPWKNVYTGRGTEALHINEERAFLRLGDDGYYSPNLNGVGE